MIMIIHTGELYAMTYMCMRYMTNVYMSKAPCD